MKKLLTILLSGLVLVACSHNETNLTSNEASAPVASAPAVDATVVASAPVATSEAPVASATVVASDVK
jgi:uncharacterized protein YcfL